MWLDDAKGESCMFLGVSLDGKMNISEYRDVLGILDSSELCSWSVFQDESSMYASI